MGRDASCLTCIKRGVECTWAEVEAGKTKSCEPCQKRKARCEMPGEESEKRRRKVDKGGKGAEKSGGSEMGQQAGLILGSNDLQVLTLAVLSMARDLRKMRKAMELRLDPDWGVNLSEAESSEVDSEASALEAGEVQDLLDDARKGLKRTIGGVKKSLEKRGKGSERASEISEEPEGAEKKGKGKGKAKKQ